MPRNMQAREVKNYECTFCEGKGGMELNGVLVTEALQLVGEMSLMYLDIPGDPLQHVPMLKSATRGYRRALDRLEDS